MRYILLFLFITFTHIAFSQVLEAGTLYRSGSVYDKDNNPSGKKIEQFLYVENENNILLLDIDELMNMQDGSIIVTYETNGYNCYQKGTGKYKVKELEVDNFKLIGKDSLFYESYRYNIGFRKVEGAVKLNDKAKLQEALFKNKYADEDLSYYYSYQSNGFVKYETGDSDWENVYRIINFEGYIILKGAVSAPKIVNKISEKKIEGLHLDYRFLQKNWQINLVEE